MGKQTGVIIVAFVTAHIALVLCAIALSTHFWLKAEQHCNHTMSNHTNMTNVTHPHNMTKLSYTKGLWQYCVTNDTTVVHHGHMNHTTNKTTGNETYSVNMTQEICYTTMTNMTSVNETVANTTVSSTKFMVSKVTYTVGVGFLCLSVISMYLILLIQNYRKSTPLATIQTACLFLSGLLVLTSLVMMGQNYMDDPDFIYLIPKMYDVDLDWAFYTAVAGDVLVFICALSSTYNLALLRSNAVPYESLYVNT